MGATRLMVLLAGISKLVKLGKQCRAQRVGVDLFGWLHQEAVTHYVRIIAQEPGGSLLRDPSPAVKDPATGRWHFWVDYVPNSDPLAPSGWHALEVACKGYQLQNQSRSRRSAVPPPFAGG
jgi:hypothetical protein